VCEERTYSVATDTLINELKKIRILLE